MPDPVDQPEKPNADRSFNELRHAAKHTIPRHLKNARTAVLHMQALRKRG